jgi:hypothetical protein
VSFYWFGVAVLAVWRLTHLLNAEDGPWEAIVRLRRLAGNGMFGGLLDCFYCLSLWVSVPFAYLLHQSWGERLLVWPALSAGAILLERITARPPTPPIALYREGEEGEDVVLR